MLLFGVVVLYLRLVLLCLLELLLEALSQILQNLVWIGGLQFLHALLNMLCHLLCYDAVPQLRVIMYQCLGAGPPLLAKWPVYVQLELLVAVNDAELVPLYNLVFLYREHDSLLFISLLRQRAVPLHRVGALIFLKAVAGDV